MSNDYDDRDNLLLDVSDRPRPVLVARPRIGLRVSGARVGDAVRPSEATPRTLPARRFGLRVNASPLARRPTDDDEAAS